MSVTRLSAHRTFGKLMEIGISQEASGDRGEAFARHVEAMERMGVEAETELLSSTDGAALFLNLALVAGRLGRADLGMELLERSRELFARVLGRERIVGPA
jgi:hypothetical protein